MSGGESMNQRVNESVNQRINEWESMKEWLSEYMNQ